MPAIPQEDGAREGVDVQRWELESRPRGYESVYCMDKDPDGEWVKHADHLSAIEAAGNAGVAVGMECGRAEVARLRAAIDEHERVRHEQMTVLEGIGQITCCNGVQHESAHVGCLYCERDKARAELAVARALMREGARHIGPMIYFSAPDLAKRVDALLVDQITPTPAAERGGSKP
jgi:hypothetical protein